MVARSTQQIVEVIYVDTALYIGYSSIFYVGIGLVI